MLNLLKFNDVEKILAETEKLLLTLKLQHMEYLPILLRIPEEQYEITITLRSDPFQVQHIFSLDRVTPLSKGKFETTVGVELIKKFILVNSRAEAERLKAQGCSISQAYTDSLKLLFGDSIKINYVDETVHRARQKGGRGPSFYTDGRRRSSSDDDDFIGHFFTQP